MTPYLSPALRKLAGLYKQADFADLEQLHTPQELEGFAKRQGHGSYSAWKTHDTARDAALNAKLQAHVSGKSPVQDHFNSAQMKVFSDYKTSPNYHPANVAAMGVPMQVPAGEHTAFLNKWKAMGNQVPDAHFDRAAQVDEIARKPVQGASAAAAGAANSNVAAGSGVQARGGPLLAPSATGAADMSSFGKVAPPAHGGGPLLQASATGVADMSSIGRAAPQAPHLAQLAQEAHMPGGIHVPAGAPGGLRGALQSSGQKLKTLAGGAGRSLTEAFTALKAPAAKILGKVASVEEEALYDELLKIGAVSEDQVQASLDRLNSLEASKPSGRQLGRYAAIGAAAAPVIGMVGNVIKHGPGGIIGGSSAATMTRMQKFRDVASDAAKGAIGTGVIPIARHHFDQEAEKKVLRNYVAENSPKLGSAQHWGKKRGKDARAKSPSQPCLAKEASGAPVSELTALREILEEMYPGEKLSGVATTPGGVMAAASKIGKTPGVMPGTGSIATIAKPKGFGKPMAGAIRNGF